MEEVKRQYINWKATAHGLQSLRMFDKTLRMNVCRILSPRRGKCEGANCLNCKYDMDMSISRNELAEVFNVHESTVTNWESGKCRPSVEDLLFYCRLCGKELNEILEFEQ